MDFVTSAYVDLTAAASKFASMIRDGQVKGKDFYYIGQPISEVLSGENARFYNGADREVPIPTESTKYNVAMGPGFWVDGNIHSSANLVAPTYSKYLDVVYYDYYGNAYGYWKKRQNGVKFNPSAKIEGFDLVIHTNHNSGAKLRECIGKQLINSGYVLVGSGDAYDEYQNSQRGIVVYGTSNTRGAGALVKDKDKLKKLSSEDKSALAASIY